CEVTDSLLMARDKHPGQRNSLDALCQRYAVDNSGRELHGALLDAEILADVYLVMTGGQTLLALGANDDSGSPQHRQSSESREIDRPAVLRVISATPEEAGAHEEMLRKMAEGGTQPLWSTEH
ncbi:MAG: exonuclease domain-containing protein, partial [Pseudomonadota bacterium]